MIHLGWDAKDALEAIQTARATRFPILRNSCGGSEVQSAAVSAGSSEREAAMSANCPTDPDPIIDLSFPHHWQAEILAARPLILSPRHFVYPRAAEEVERGALEVMIRPDAPNAQPFLATCALGFRDPAAPTGFWSTPEPEKIWRRRRLRLLVDTTVPERFTMIPYRLCWKCAR